MIRCRLKFAAAVGRDFATSWRKLPAVGLHCPAHRSTRKPRFSATDLSISRRTADDTQIGCDHRHRSTAGVVDVRRPVRVVVFALSPCDSDRHSCVAASSSDRTRCSRTRTATDPRSRPRRLSSPRRAAAHCSRSAYLHRQQSRHRRGPVRRNSSDLPRSMSPPIWYCKRTAARRTQCRSSRTTCRPAK